MDFLNWFANFISMEHQRQNPRKCTRYWFVATDVPYDRDYYSLYGSTSIDALAD